MDSTLSPSKGGTRAQVGRLGQLAPSKLPRVRPVRTCGSLLPNSDAEGGIDAQERFVGLVEPGPVPSWVRRAVAHAARTRGSLLTKGGFRAQERHVGRVEPGPARSRVRAVAAAAARTYAPPLTRPVWLLQAGGFASAVGSGLVFPFVLIYLHDLRGISLGRAGLALGAYGLASLAATPFAGALVDRLGARTVMRVSLVLLALGYGAFGFVGTMSAAVAALALAGVGNGGFWPSQSTLVVASTAAEHRHQASAVSRAAYNLGLGAGAALGGLVLAHASATRFEVLFVLDAVTFVLFALLTVFVPAVAAAETARKAGGYRLVARDRIFVALIALNVIYVATAFAPFESSLPVFARDQLGLSPRAIGFVFLANMLAVGVVQLPVARLLEGRSRLRMLAAMTVLFAATFAIVLAARTLHAPLVAGALVVAAVVFAVGECILGPAHGPMVIALAPPELQGRYLAVLTSSYALGFTLGPSLAAVGLGVSPSGMFGVAALACLVAGVAGLRLERRLPDALRRTPAHA
jgi:MFS family permease